MKLFKFTILFALAGVVSASNFIEVNIDKLRINEANKSGQIGTLLFKSAIITRDSLSFNLQKKEDHSFNSSVTYINKQLSMSNDMLTAQFDMSDNEFLDDVSL